jgi:hypothetical protein
MDSGMGSGKSGNDEVPFERPSSFSLELLPGCGRLAVVTHSLSHVCVGWEVVVVGVVVVGGLWQQTARNISRNGRGPLGFSSTRAGD